MLRLSGYGNRLRCGTAYRGVVCPKCLRIMYAGKSKTILAKEVDP
jgi:hypothetical protein